MCIRDSINSEIKDLNHEISLVVINDASSQQIIDTYPNIENISSFEIINMKENRGHARCIASGLKYIYEKKEFDYVIPMDGDGEDRPEEIKNFIEIFTIHLAQYILFQTVTMRNCSGLLVKKTNPSFVS